MDSYELEGQAGGSVGTIIGLIVGIGIAVLVLIFVGVLGGQTFNIVETKVQWYDVNADCNSELMRCGAHTSGIQDANIADDIHDAISSGFDALKTTGEYLPVVVIAFIVIIILGMILGLMAISGRTIGGGQGTAL